MNGGWRRCTAGASNAVETTPFRPVSPNVFFELCSCVRVFRGMLWIIFVGASWLGDGCVPSALAQQALRAARRR